MTFICQLQEIIIRFDISLVYDVFTFTSSGISSLTSFCSWWTYQRKKFSSRFFLTRSNGISVQVGEGTGLKMREAEFYRCQLQEKSRSGLSVVSFMRFFILRLQEFSLWSSWFIWRVAGSNLPVLRVSLEKRAIFIPQWGSRKYEQDHSVRIKIVMKPLKRKEIFVCGQS